MTSEELEAIRGRERAARDFGAWSVNVDDYGILTLIENDGNYAFATLDYKGSNAERAEFIAHARADVPALLAEVDRLKAAQRFEDGQRSNLLSLLLKAEAEAKRLRAALKEIEWAGGEFDGHCPACGQGQGEPHSKRCSIDRALNGEGAPCSA